MLCCDYLWTEGFIPTAASPRSQLLVRDSIRWTPVFCSKVTSLSWGRQDPVTSLCVWYKVPGLRTQVGQLEKALHAGHPKGWLRLWLYQSSRSSAQSSLYTFPIDVHPVCWSPIPSLFPSLNSNKSQKIQSREDPGGLTPRSCPNQPLLFTVI